MKFSDIDLLKFGHEIQITGFFLTEGADKAYVAMFPSEEWPIGAHVERLEMDTQDFEKFLYQSDVLDVELTFPKKAIVRKSQRQIDANVSWAVFRRDGYRCRYCGKNDVPLTVDHVVTWESGGPSVQENLLSACKKCNRTRGSRGYVEWLMSDDYTRASKGLHVQVYSLNASVMSQIPYLESLRVEHVRSR